MIAKGLQNTGGFTHFPIIDIKTIIKQPQLVLSQKHRIQKGPLIIFQTRTISQLLT